MKKIKFAVTFLAALFVMTSANSANLIHEKTVKFQKDPIGYLEKYAKQNPLSDGHMYIASNVSANIWISAIGLFSGKELIELWNPDGGEMKIFRLEGLESTAKLAASTVISYESPFDGDGELKMDLYLVKPDGSGKAFVVDEKFTLKNKVRTMKTLRFEPKPIL